MSDEHSNKGLQRHLSGIRQSYFMLRDEEEHRRHTWHIAWAAAIQHERSQWTARALETKAKPYTVNGDEA